MRSDALARLRVGTSGWSYREWRGQVYPQRLPAARWLRHYAGLFDTVELNVTFHRLLGRRRNNLRPRGVKRGIARERSPCAACA